MAAAPGPAAVPPPEAVPPTRPSWMRRSRGFVLALVGLVVASGSALVLGGIVASQTGSTGLLVGAGLATVPVVFVVAAFLWLDRWEPEPLRHLVQAFVWGATVAALLAVVVNTVALGWLAESVGEESARRIVAVGVAPFVEEAAKGAFLLFYLWRNRHEFDGVTDGIVLGGLAAAGFAFTENILYFGRAYSVGLDEAGDITGAVAAGTAFVLRAIVSPFAHPLFTVMTGIGVGIAAVSSSWAVRVLAPLGGYLVAVGLHALWNGSALFDQGQDFVMLYVTVMVPVFCLAVTLAVWSRAREGQVLRRQLPAYAAAGWIAPYELPLLASLAYRRRTLRAAARLGGPDARAATRAYHAAATELAFLRERVIRGTAGPDAARRQDGLLATLVAARPMAYVPRVPVAR